MRDRAHDATPGAHLVEVSVTSRLEQVELLARAARRFAADAGLTPAQVARVELCVVEAANNAIRHAYRGAPDRPVTMSWAHTTHALRIGISERGEPMREAPRGDLPAPRESGGRGWFLLRRCMDAVEYRSEHGVNTVLMTLRLDGEAVGAPRAIPNLPSTS